MKFVSNNPPGAGGEKQPEKPDYDRLRRELADKNKYKGLLGNKPVVNIQAQPQKSPLPSGAIKNQQVNMEKYKQMLNMPGNNNLKNQQNFKPAFVDHLKADKEKVAEIMKAADPRIVKEASPMKKHKSENSNELNNKQFDVQKHVA